MDTRSIVIERAPPKRLFQPGRFRTFKLPEARSWARDTDPILHLLQSGWRAKTVHIEFGDAMPLTPSARESMARALTLCGTPCELRMTSGQPGRGRTVWSLVWDLTRAS